MEFNILDFTRFQNMSEIETGTLASHGATVISMRLRIIHVHDFASL